MTWTKADELAIAEGIKHYQEKPHDKTICPTCELRAQHLARVTPKKAVRK